MDSLSDIVAGLLGLTCCLGVPGGLLAGFIWMLSRNRTTARQATDRSALLTEMQELVWRWLAEGRISSEVAAQISTLLNEEHGPWGDAAPAPPVGPDVAQPPGVQRPGAPAPPVGPDVAQPPGVQRPGAPVPAPAPALAAASAAAEAAPAVPPATLPARPGPQASIWGALLALRTRMTLLFLGAFLLIVSALTLVIFNWASFPPILQLGLLAGVCGGFWGLGIWLARRPGLRQAGISLQAVGGILIPVVAFALARPGLLDLPFDWGWLLASGISLPIYVLATVRLRHILFVIAGCLAAASAMLALTNLVLGSAWFSVALIVTCGGYLATRHLLRTQGMADLDRAPFYVAHILAPLTLLVALMVAQWGGIATHGLMLTLWLGVGFYGAATWQDRAVRWVWASAVLIPLALQATLEATQVPPEWGAFALALLALAYLAGSAVYEQRLGRFVVPGYVGAAILGLLAGQLVLVAPPDVTCWTLSVLILGLAGGVWAYHRGCFAGVHAVYRVGVSMIALTLAALLVPLWVWSLLDLLAMPILQRPLVVLVLPIAYAVGAYWQPGRLHRAYDIALQVVAMLIATTALLLTLFDQETAVYGCLLFAAFWGVQAFLRQHWLYATLTLGAALLVGIAVLFRLDSADDVVVQMGLLTGFAATYLLGATWLRTTRWRLWTVPGLGWGSLLGLVLTGYLVVAVIFASLTAYLLTQLVLLAVLVVLMWQWRNPLIGYPAAVLVGLIVPIAAYEGYLLPMRVTGSDLASVLCGVATGLFLLGQALRSRAALTPYSSPYVVVGFAVAAFALLPASNSAAHLTLVWATIAVLAGLATWRYRMPWLLAPALGALDMLILSGAAWQFSGGDPSGIAPVFLGLTWAQAALGLWTRRREQVPPVPPLTQRYHLPAFAVALLSGLGTVLFASSSLATLSGVLFGLSVLLALIATVEQEELLAWAALVLLAASTTVLFALRDLGGAWSQSWGVVVALILALVGWGIARLPHTAIWHRPLVYGPLVGGSLLTLILILTRIGTTDLAALTVALAALSALLATVTVRLRQNGYGYAAGAALVGALLCQFADWGLTQPQWYAVPIGLYLLVVAECIRRFQRQIPQAQLFEAGGVLVLLGTTLGQSLRADGWESDLYAIAVCIESAVVLAYGTLRKLRVPFVGGIGFFVLGILWISVDPVLALNQWVLLGLIGIILVGVYVLLEQRQEQLLRAGRVWVARLQQWE